MIVLSAGEKVNFSRTRRKFYDCPCTYCLPKPCICCHACETCFKTGKACSFDDDFNIIAPAILKADAIVFTMPVYWYSIPAQIKGVIDRIYSLVVGGKDIAGKECALIACCEEEDLSVLDGVRIPMERTAALNKWKMVGEVLIPGVLNAGDINKTDGCRQAAELVDKI